MPQYLKEEVRERIEDAALRAFADGGYEGTTMADIAREAGISTGNIYRYHESKEALFRSVLPDAFVRRLRSLLRERLEAARGEKDVDALSPYHPYSLVAGRMLDFCIENRLRMVILLGGSRGTRYEDVRRTIVDELVGTFLRHARDLDPELEVGEHLRFVIGEVYRSFVATLARILESFEEPEMIREATDAFTRYHQAGLARLLG